MRRVLAFGRPVAGSLAVMFFVAACGASNCSGSDPTDGATTVNVTLSEFEIALSTADIAAGEVTFNITNDGEMVHEFVIFDTDLAEDDLPMAADADEVDEEQLTVVDEVEDIEPGATASLTVTLDAGDFVAICNVSGHYSAGMHVAITAS